jgi:hypothetical protein
MLKLSIPLLVTAFVATSYAEAGQYNQPRHLKVGSQAKVSRVIAKSKTLTNQAKSNTSETPGCGEDRNGVIVDRGIGDEKIVVVTKDIINTGGNVEIGRDCN